MNGFFIKLNFYPSSFNKTLNTSIQFYINMSNITISNNPSQFSIETVNAIKQNHVAEINKNNDGFTS